MKLNEKTNFIVKLLILLFMLADLILSIVLLKNNKDIRDDLYYMDSDINSIEYSIDKIQKDITEIKENIDDIQSDVNDIEYYLN